MSRATILSVNDLPHARYATTRHLESCGYKVIEAATGEEALSKLPLGPELILLDVHLPDVHGFELCDRIRAATSERWIPIVLVSSVFIDPAHIAEGLHRGADGYLTQPADPDVLLAMVAAYLRAATQLRLKTEALRLRNEAIEALPTGLIITDARQPDNPIIYANPGFCEMTGYSRQEVVGRNCRFLQGAGSDKETLQEIRKALQKAERIECEVLNYTKKGTPFWNALSISPILDEGGKVTHFVGVQRDITAQKNLQDQLRQSQKLEAVGHLAGGIAHDFNNLLAVIMGYANLLEAKNCTPEEMKAAVREIAQAADRGAQLTRQLLTFSRRQIVQPAILSVDAVLRGMEKLLSRLVGEDILLEFTYAPDLWSAQLDPTQLEQTILNLVLNARDAMPHGGRLKLRTYNTSVPEAGANPPPGDYVVLEVEDTGGGIHPDIQARIFEPFFTTKGDRGSGLGLAIVYASVQQAHGHISVESAPGRGALFTVHYPRALKPALSNARPEKAILRGDETVLVVEDDPFVRSLVEHTLASLGYHVVTASGPEEAIAMASDDNFHFDLLLTDVVMPGGTGGELAETLRASVAGLKVIFMSGYPDDDLVLRGVQKDGVAFLAKPFTPSALSQMVRRALDEPSR
ncbi:MAG TPA: response regulator [Methylomirabilota bacterium]|nr:response regulator [Methylomirabilota bacterium]